MIHKNNHLEPDASQEQFQDGQPSGKSPQKKYLPLRIVATIFVILCLLCVGLFVGGICVLLVLNAPPDRVQRELLFDITEGEPALVIGRRLVAAGAIRDEGFWYALNRWKQLPLKVGSYKLELPANQDEIYAVLAEGHQSLVKVTIPEGLTMSKTARIIEGAGVCSAEAFLAAARDPELLASYAVPAPSFEGYLFPDTYFFEENYPAEKVLSVLVDNFFKRLSEISDEEFAPEEIFEKVILASIVEREYRIEEEAKLMAGVFYNRLKIKMALQSCATVEYVITEIQGKPHPEVLLTRDTEIKDPYNTYVNRGLPPGPIANPGLTALDAVLYPVESNYLYFRLIDPDSGKHYFSRTFDGHIKAGKLYVKP